VIKPTIGRVVWYTPATGERIRGQPNDQKLAAHVTYVWSDRTINIMAITPNGDPYGVRSVTLIQDGDPYPVDRYCEWMPYQIGQAKNHEKEMPQ
jgi:hypothetical protein